MTFTNMCVGLVICILVLIVSGVFSALASTTDDSTFLGWVVSSIGFGSCLTILLVEHGIIK